MCLLSFLKWGSIGYSLGIVQWDFTRRDHPGNPGRVSGSGLVKVQLEQMKEEQKIMLINMSVMPPIQAEYFKRLQMEIVAKKM